MRERVNLIILIAIMLFGLCGCMSKEENEHLNEIAKEALAYIEEKYGEDFSVRDFDYVLIDSTLFPTYSDDVEIRLEDGTEILYVAEENRFYDSYQAEEICKALEEEIFNPMLEQLKPYYFEPTTYETMPNFNFFNEDGCQGNFFHTYYDGDIKEFADLEKPGMEYGYFDENGKWSRVLIYLIAEGSDDWQDRVDNIKEIREKFFCGQWGHELVFVALTQELYEKEIAGAEKNSVNISMEGCWATGTATELWIQNYIKIGDGVYVTADESNFVLEEGDITWKEVMTPEELQQIKAVTPVYEMEFSQRIFEFVSEKSFLSLYIKFVPEELGISAENNLYKYSIRGDKTLYHENQIVVLGNSDYAGQIFLRDNDDAEYFWIGIQSKE